MKRWVQVTKSAQGATKVTGELVVTQREASDLIIKHVKGVAGIRVCADEKLQFAKHSGDRIQLTPNSYLQHKEWP